MPPKVNRRTLARLLALVAFLTMTPSRAHAQARLGLPVDPDAPLASKALPEPAAVSTFPIDTLTPEQVEQIVEKYLASKEAKKKEEQLSSPAEKEKSYAVGRSLDLKAYWREGLQVQTEDQAFRVHVGGLIHVDGGWWHPEPQVSWGQGGVGPLDDGAMFRRGRIHVNGQMYEVVDWVVEYGFENRLPQFFNVYTEITHLPVLGTVRVGHFREPFGMDALTGYNNLTFLERSLLTEPFFPFFNIGVMVWGNLLDQHMTYASGIFRTRSDNFNGADFGDGSYSYTSRLTVNPWYEEGEHALHLGVAHSYRVLPRLNVQGEPVPVGGVRSAVFLSRPEERVNAPFFVNTGLIPADHDNLIGAELGLSVGPFLVQGEYVAALVDRSGPAAPRFPGAGTARDTVFFHGFYMQVSYFLTGEHRPYVQKEGIFGIVRPHENFFCVRGEDRPDRSVLFGRGAWEIGVRYSQLDLDNRGIDGGNLRDLTIGLNWYLNPNCRIAWNYLLIWRDVAGDTSDGLTQALGARFQMEF